MKEIKCASISGCKCSPFFTDVFYPGASSLTGSSESGDGPQKLTLVYFLGGCTYAEVAALRFLSLQDNGMARYAETIV